MSEVRGAREWVERIEKRKEKKQERQITNKEATIKWNDEISFVLTHTHNICTP